MAYKKFSSGSDGLLLTLAVIAAAVSFVAFMFSFGWMGVTGNAIEQGNVNATISSTASIRMNVSSIQFGSGSIASGGGGVVLDSNFSNGLTTGPASGTFNRSLPANNGDGKRTGGLVVENDGNVNVNLQVNIGTAVNTAICQGQAGCTGGTPAPNFQLMWMNNMTNACTLVSQAQHAYFVPAVAPSFTNLCNSGGFQFTNGNDRVEVHARITMNDQTPPGVINEVVTFSAN